VNEATKKPAKKQAFQVTAGVLWGFAAAGITHTKQAEA
jgi:hypothetical protein